MREKPIRVPLLPPLELISGMPSMTTVSFPPRRPFVLAELGLPPTEVTTPGRSWSKRSKLRPFKGSALTVWLLMVPPKVASVVSMAGTSPVTVTVWVCSPGCTTKSTRIF